MYPRKILSVAVPISSNKNISSDEDEDARRGTVNSKSISIVYKSTELSYESTSKDKHHDFAHEPGRHYFNTTDCS